MFGLCVKQACPERIDALQLANPEGLFEDREGIWQHIVPMTWDSAEANLCRSVGDGWGPFLCPRCLRRVPGDGTLDAHVRPTLDGPMTPGRRAFVVTDPPYLLLQLGTRPVGLFYPLVGWHFERS